MDSNDLLHKMQCKILTIMNDPFLTIIGLIRIFDNNYEHSNV